MSEPLTIIAYLRAKPGQETRVRQALEGLLGPTRAEAGCIDYDLHQSQEDPARFVFYENWASAAHLEAHGRSPHIQALNKLATEILAARAEISRWTRVR